MKYAGEWHDAKCLQSTNKTPYIAEDCLHDNLRDPTWCDSALKSPITLLFLRLELLGLERLESRRITADALFAYKLLFDLAALHSDDFFILRESTCTRGHHYKHFLPRCSVDQPVCRKNMLFLRRSDCTIVRMWPPTGVDRDDSLLSVFNDWQAGSVACWVAHVGPVAVAVSLCMDI